MHCLWRRLLCSFSAGSSCLFELYCATLLFYVSARTRRGSTLEANVRSFPSLEVLSVAPVRTVLARASLIVPSAPAYSFAVAQTRERHELVSRRPLAAELRPCVFISSSSPSCV